MSAKRRTPHAMSAFAKRESKLLANRLGAASGAISEADSSIYACPDGPACRDKDCIAENKRRAALRSAKHERLTAYEGRALREMQDMLASRGFDAAHAIGLQAEGMGPEELRGRLVIPTGTGSLQHTHGLKKRDLERDIAAVVGGGASHSAEWELGFAAGIEDANAERLNYNRAHAEASLEQLAAWVRSTGRGSDFAHGKLAGYQKALGVNS